MTNNIKKALTKKNLDKVNKLSSKDMRKLMKFKYPIKVSAKNTVPIDWEEEIERNKEMSRISSEGKTLYAHGTIGGWKICKCKKGECPHDKEYVQTQYRDESFDTGVVCNCKPKKSAGWCTHGNFFFNNIKARGELSPSIKKEQLLEAMEKLESDDYKGASTVFKEEVIKLINEILK